MQTSFSIQREAAWISLAVALAFAAPAAPLQIVSTVNTPSVPAPGGGDSDNPIMSSDGRYVLFASTANNLAVTSSNAPFLARVPSPLNVFLRDRTNETTTLISLNVAGTGGGNGDSIPAGVSTNGRYVLFESSASDLVSSDTNDACDVFVRDTILGTTSLVSVNTNGGCANGASSAAVMTPDGRLVAFASAASDLVPGDTNNIQDIFVRDLQSGVTVRASSDGLNNLLPPPPFGSYDNVGSDTPRISPDGRHIVFLSQIGSSGIAAVFVTDLADGVTVLANSNAIAATTPTTQPKVLPYSPYSLTISDEGRYVVFETCSSTSNVIQRFDLKTDLTDLINSDSVFGLAGSSNPRPLDATPDGQRVVFVGRAAGQGAATSCVYVWDAQSGTTTLVSAAPDGSIPTNAICDWPVISASGRYVAFLSTATNLTTNVVSGDFHLFVRDLQTGVTRLVDVGPDGTGSPKDFLNAPCFGADGRLLAFDCTDGNLVPDDNNRAYDVFVCDTAAGSNELVSVRQPSLPSQTPSCTDPGSAMSIGTSGRYIALSSSASGLIPNDTNTYRGVFVHDLLTGTNLLVSVDTNGLAGADGMSTDPSLSGDGRFVAFASSADNLVADDTNSAPDVFVRDLQTGVTSLISVNTNGVGTGNGASHSPEISEDGRFVLFQSNASNLAPGVFNSPPNLFLRDRQSDNTHALTLNGVASALMTPDGHFVTFRVAASVYVWDTLAAVSTRLNLPAPVPSLVAISPDGNRIVYFMSIGFYPGGLYTMDRASGKAQMIDSALSGSSHLGWQFSGDARFLAYATTTAQVPSDTNGVSDVYLYDFASHTNLLISRSDVWPGAANGASDSPAISTDGRFVAFRSAATDLVPGVTNRFPNVFLCDRQTGTMALLSASVYSAAGGNFWSLLPQFSGDSQTVVFQSWASDLVSRDFNQASDIFTVKIAAANPTTTFVGQMVFAPAPGQPSTLTWPAAPGQNYEVEFKNNLGDAVWQPMDGNVWVSGNQAFATDLAPNAGQRFYRIKAF